MAVQWFKTLPSNAGGVGLISGWEAIPQAVQPKKPPKNRSNIVTNSIKTFKMAHIKKSKKKKIMSQHVSTRKGLRDSFLFFNLY